MLEWRLDAPFTPQDKPPLAVAIVIKSGDRRKWKRYRLVVARREKLRLPQRVLAVLDANTATSSGFFPCAISKEYLYGYATDGYRSPLWLCAAFERRPCGEVGRAVSFDIADRLPVVVRFPAGPQVSLKVGDQPKGRWRRPQKKGCVLPLKAPLP